MEIEATFPMANAITQAIHNKSEAKKNLMTEFWFID